MYSTKHAQACAYKKEGMHACVHMFSPFFNRVCFFLVRAMHDDSMHSANKEETKNVIVK